MQKILCISYFFPPCNLTASQRSYSWANYLKEYGYYPVIITRRWDHKINLLSDVSKATPNEILHEKKDGYEVFYLPYQPNLKDRIYAQHDDKKYVSFRKVLTLIELLLQNFTNSVIQYKNIYQYSRKYLKENPDVKLMVVTGNPFNLFKFGYQLHKEFGIKWIADYRDAWTTSEINMIGKGFLFRMIEKLDKAFEKKWTGTASLVTASSQPIADGVTDLVGVEGHALYNGFVKEDFDVVTHSEPFEDFTITYVGTLYDGQQIEIFCEALKKLVDTTKSEKIKFLLPGLAFYKAQKERLDKLMKGYEAFYECTERMERAKILEIEKRSHLLLHVAWKGFKGIIASKIYEYIASGSYILVTPSDEGSIEQIVKSSGCGTTTNTVDETYQFLLQTWEEYQQGIKKQNNLDSPQVNQFSRQLQVGQLAGFLDKIKGS